MRALSRESAEDGALSAPEYRRLVESAETYRKALVVRLIGEAGLRTAELVRLRPEDVRSAEDRSSGALLDVRSESGERDRIAYLSADLRRSLDRYVESNEIDADEPVIGVSPRRVQMLVSEVAGRAADRSGDGRLADVTPVDLRAHFARTLLVEDGVDPRVVLSVGGWESFESFDRVLGAVDEATIAAELSDADAEVDDASRATPSDGGEGDLAQASSDGDTRAEELRERAERLERRTEVGDRIRAVDDAVLSASDRDELEATVCERLARGEEYTGAWIATSDLTDERPTPTALAGIDRPAVDALAEQFDERSTAPPWIEAVRDDAVREAEMDGSLADIVADDPREDADSTDAEAVTAVPLSHRETTYGVLVVATDRGAPEDWERSELAALGRRIGHALTAIQRRNLLLSDAAVELEFRCRDEGAFFVDASEHLDCAFVLESIVPVSASSLLFHVTVEGAPPGDVFDRAVEHRGVEEVRLVETHGDGALLEFVVGGDSPLLTLAAHGATITDAVFEDGDADLVAEVAQDADLRAVVDGLRTAFPATELVGKRETERPVRTVREFREGVEDELTDRQEATLRAAYYAGYFDWPRGSTAEEVADSMDVSSPTLHNHLRKGQRALLDTFFEGSVGGE